MPTYVGLGQQGFYDDTAALNSGIRSFMDRRQKQSEFDKTMAFKGAELDQEKIMNEARRKALEQAMAEQQFKLGEEKKAAGQRDFLATLPLDKYNTPRIPTPYLNAGPAQSFDQSQQWSVQPEELRQKVLADAAKNMVSPDQVAQAYNARVTANTGKPVLPMTPPGMRVQELDFPGGKMAPDYAQGMGAAGGAGIKTMKDDAGNEYRYFLDPITGHPQFVHPDMAMQRIGRLTGEENDKLAGFQNLNQNLDELQKSLNTVSSNDRGPIAGRWKFGQSMLNPNSYIEGRGVQSPQAAAVNDKWQAMWLNLARSLGEKGNLSDTDKRSWESLKPSLFDTPAVADQKIKDMRDMAARSYNTYLNTLKSSGRNVNLSATGSGAAEPQVFNSEAEAMKANLPDGAEIQVRQSDGSVRKFRFRK